MVFGWGKKKSTKDTVESLSERQVSISEINTILKENEARRLGTLAQNAKSIRDQVDKGRKNIIDIISQLEEDDLKVDEVDKHLQSVIERGKKAVIGGIKKETAINLSKTEKYSDIVNLNAEVGQLLKRIGDILGANTKVMNIFARKYADRLKENLADMAANKADLQKIVDNHAKFESTVSSALEDTKKIADSKREMEEKNVQLVEIKKEIQNLENKIKSLEDSIQILKSKNDYHEFLNVKNEIDSLSSERDKIKYEIDLQFSKISRPLGKYSYISSLDKPLKKIMNSMIENPLETITQENKNSIIEVLQAVVKGVVAGNVSVKDSQKAAEQIEETINRLDEFLKMKEALSQKRVALENKLGVFDIRILEEKERELHNARSKKEQDESKVRALQDEINEAIQHIPRLLSVVENKLKDAIGSKITLKIN